MQRMTEEKFDDDLLLSDLLGKAAKPGFVFIGRRAHCQLRSERFCESPTHSNGRGIVDFRTRGQTERCAKLIFVVPMHSHEQTALLSFTASPVVDGTIKQPPSSQIEISHAEIGTI